MSRSAFLIALLAIAGTAACGSVSSSDVDAAVDGTITETFTVTVTATGNGTGTVTSAPVGIDCGSDCSQVYEDGTSITLTAAPATGSAFVGWTGGGCTGTGACTISVGADVAVSAAFALDRTLVVTLAGTGAGTVTSSPAGINCGADCDEIYAAGTAVTLTATPTAGSTFAGWSGGCSGAGACAVTLDAAVMVTATFTLDQVLLTVVTAGNGQGIVTSLPAGIACGADCIEPFNPGTSVTLTATPAIGSTFTGWSGGGCVGAGPCTLVINAATAISATFTLSPTLSVTRSGTGTGSVSSAPAGISCGADCTEAYTFGTSVVLTATPAVGSTFTGWAGGGCSGVGMCNLAVIADTTVTATFTLTTHLLTVTRGGNGAGAVTSVPAGISCGVDCTEIYNYGQTVVLTAAPAVGSTFTGWAGGGCSGAGACTTSITAATTVTATFTLTTHLLTVTRAGAGTGTVTSVPAGIICGVDCTELYNYGQTVVLAAAPAAGSTFAGWAGGGCAGVGTCTTSITAATTVTATFGCASGSMTLNLTGALQTFTVPGCTTSITIDARGAQGGGGGTLGGVGGLGARAVGTFPVTGGSLITVLVGGRGLAGINDNQQSGGTGGGGSFVVNASGQALVVAGGGGGAIGNGALVADGGPGQAGTAGAAGNTNGGAGGISGGGGTTWPWAGWHSGTGGGGFTGDGVNNSNGDATQFGSVNQPGRAYANGGAGGIGGTSGRNGGYGGGGSAGFTGAGGGGYSGGGSGAPFTPVAPNGGGGGSISTGTSPITTAGFNAGNGSVIITW